MSYILDALRRADAERERDPARGIHAQPAAGVPVPSRSRVPGWAWPAGACVVLLAAGFVGWQRSAPPPAPVVSVAPVAPVAPVVRPAPAVVPVAAVVMPPPPAAPVALAPAMKAPPAAPVAAKPATSAAEPALAAASASGRIYNVAELPQDVQGQLPKLAITGGVHSDNPAQRMLIVAGQVVNEGAELAPGVVLEQIRPRTAVLRFRGWRYSVGF